MSRHPRALVPALLLWNLCCVGRTALADPRRYVRIDSVGSARVLSEPAYGDRIGRIPAGARVEIFETRDIRTGMIGQTWYLVKVKKQTGWISQYVTTGDMETEQGGAVNTEQVPHAGSPRLYR